MSEGSKENVAGVLALVTWLVFTTSMVFFSFGQWGDQMKAQRHRKDWAVHSGTVMSVDQPNYSQDPPYTPATINFRDYYGQARRVDLDLPYGWHAGETTPIDVGSSGAIFAPAAVDWTNQAQDDPFKAHADFWPGAGIVLLAGIGGVVVGLISFPIYMSIVTLGLFLSREHEKKRLARRARNRLLSSEEIEARERELGLFEGIRSRDD